MFAQWRLMLCKAEHALDLGQLEEAGRFVTSPDVRSFRGARQLRAKVAAALAARAREHLDRGLSDRAWQDLAEAQRLEAGEQLLGEVRQQLIDRSLAEATACFDEGNPDRVAECLSLSRHGVDRPDCRRLQVAAAAWESGRRRAREGRFAQALGEFESARRLHSCPLLDQAISEATRHLEQAAAAETRLHQALSAQAWPEVLARADELLAVAPEHAAASQARRRAWQAVGMADRPSGGRTALPHAARAADHPVSGPNLETETACFRLWVDAVGGFLVSLRSCISIGQAGNRRVDIPIMADLSRLHAWIEREGEGYLLRAVRPATINGRPVGSVAPLADRDEIGLASALRLRFRRPHPLSGTARLEIVGPQRFGVAADAALLMAESCVIGPAAASHVVAPHWDRQVVLHRRGNEFWCRMPGEFQVDGRTCREEARLSLGSRIKADGLSWALESLAEEPLSAAGGRRGAKS